MLSGYFDFTGITEVQDYPAGLTAHLTLGYGPFMLIGEYLGALDAFQVKERRPPLPWVTRRQMKPWPWSICTMKITASMRAARAMMQMQQPYSWLLCFSAIFLSNDSKKAEF